MRQLTPFLCSAALIALGAATSLLASGAPERDVKPNVVVIMVDTMRAGFTGVHGHTPDTTPFLTRIAERSAVFDNAFSTSSWTAPSTASLFTSLYPHQHGVTQGFYAHEDVVFNALQAGGTRIPLTAMADALVTLPEMFQAAGYRTFCAAANRNIDREMGFRSGFELFSQENDRNAEGLYDVLRDWRREIRRGEPYFLYLHLMDPHFPYRTHTPHYARYDAPDDLQRQYLSEITYADAWIARVFKLLRMDRNTLVIFVTDHGEEFLDHGNTQHGPYLYDELQRVMLMVYGPELGVEPARHDINVSLVDVLPTLADFLGMPAPAPSEGASLLPFSRGEPDRQGPRFWTERVLLGQRTISAPPYYANWSAIQGRWKYIEHVGREPELFDHSTDPRELDNVHAVHRETAARLASAIEAARGAAPRYVGDTKPVPLDPQLIEELRSLGYTN